MADVRISELPAKGAVLAAGDQLEINDSGTSKRITGQEIMDGIPIEAPSRSAFLAYNSVTDSDVTGNGTVVTVEFDTEVFDLGADFCAVFALAVILVG